MENCCCVAVILRRRKQSCCLLNNWAKYFWNIFSYTFKNTKCWLLFFPFKKIKAKNPATQISRPRPRSLDKLQMVCLESTQNQPLLFHNNLIENNWRTFFDCVFSAAGLDLATQPQNSIFLIFTYSGWQRLGACFSHPNQNNLNHL